MCKFSLCTVVMKVEPAEEARTIKYFVSAVNFSVGFIFQLWRKNTNLCKQEYICLHTGRTCLHRAGFEHDGRSWGSTAKKNNFRNDAVKLNTCTWLVFEWGSENRPWNACCWFLGSQQTHWLLLWCCGMWVCSVHIHLWEYSSGWIEASECFSWIELSCSVAESTVRKQSEITKSALKKIYRF